LLPPEGAAGSPGGPPGRQRRDLSQLPGRFPRAGKLHEEAPPAGHSAAAWSSKSSDPVGGSGHPLVRSARCGAASAWAAQASAATGVVVGDGGLSCAWAWPRKGICGVASRRPGWRCAASGGGVLWRPTGPRWRRGVAVGAAGGEDGDDRRGMLTMRLCHGGMVGAPAAGTCDFGRKLLQWRCGSAAEMSLDWSGHGGDAGSCAMRVHQGWVALGESPCQLHVGGMATTSLDVVFPVEGVISEL
jgi:hypothetical protein